MFRVRFSHGMLSNVSGDLRKKHERARRSSVATEGLVVALTPRYVSSHYELQESDSEEQRPLVRKATSNFLLRKYSRTADTLHSCSRIVSIPRWPLRETITPWLHGNATRACRGVTAAGVSQPNVAPSSHRLTVDIQVLQRSNVLHDSQQSPGSGVLSDRRAPCNTSIR